jgi:ornithine--oxo-acid transaminase
MNHFNPGSHGSTFGGNPLAARVASKALDLLFEDNLIENSKLMGSYLKEKLKEMNHSFIREVRGKGLWIGVELDSNISAKKICLSLMKEGILAKETHETIIRFAPPLLIKKEEIDWAIKKINKVFKEYQ